MNPRTPPLRFIAPMPRLTGDGQTWVADLRRLEDMGFDTVCISEHLTNGWQLSALAAMSYAAASTSRLRILSLVLQNDLHHPALLAKSIATIDVLSGGRVELGLGAGWNPDDCHAVGLPFDDARTRVARLAEGVEVIREYFTGPIVDFDGKHYRVDHMEALPRCVQRPRPPILIGAGGPAMLELAGRRADIVGIHAAMGRPDLGTAAADLSAASIAAKIARVRDAAAAADRTPPALQFTCYHVRVTDASGGDAPRSSWAAEIEARHEALTGSPALLVGTAAQCAESIAEWSRDLGISYWHLGHDVTAAALIIAALRSTQPDLLQEQTCPVG